MRISPEVTMNKSTRIANLILDTFGSRTEIEWSDIVSAVREKEKVKNWLTEVRGPLQWLINNGHIVRVPDIRREAYQRVR